jgi:hypothetical protein
LRGSYLIASLFFLENLPVSGKSHTSLGSLAINEMLIPAYAKSKTGAAASPYPETANAKAP